ncbi:MAG TPA: hypothetical protein VGK20_14145 [Candidatus Binatia bacterium]|jgi:hypothetical protein
MSRAGIVGLVLSLAGLGWILAGSMSAGEHTCDVCMAYNGRSQCRSVAAATVELAREGAITNACAYISGGVTDSMACHRVPPASEKCQ